MTVCHFKQSFFKQITGYFVIAQSKLNTIFIYVFVFLFSDRVGADITVLREREVDYDSDVPRKIAEVLIRKVPDDQQVSRAKVKSCCFLVDTLLLCILYIF